MQFFSFLSDFFYDKVVLLLLKSGHSHMFPDRATAHANNAVKNRNIYHPNDVISIVNTVQGLNAEFLDHNAPKPPFFIGWDALMAKYFQPMPGGFTNNFFFEFDKGVCTVFERADTPNSEAWSVIMFPTLEECQECLKICSVPSRYLRNYF